MKIEIEDLLKLEKPVFVEMEKEVREFIFNSFDCFQKELASRLGKELNKKVTQEDISKWKSGKVKTRLDIFHSLLKLSNLSIDSLKSKIAISAESRGNKISGSIFPIKKSPEMAYLIAKVMGDGSINKNDGLFRYDNTEISLIEKVRETVCELFGKIYYNENKYNDTFYISFPRIIGDILRLFGAPKGKKVLTKFLIPEWIMNGNKETKKAFLQGIFDDEGWIEKNKIGICLGKTKLLEYNLDEFLTQIKSLLEEFDIFAGNILLDKEYQVKKEVHIKKRLQICSFYNIRKFDKEIGFSHPFKQSYLKNILMKNNNIKIQMPKGYTLRKIFNSLPERNFTVSEIAKNCNVSYRYTHKCFKKLQSERFIKLESINKRNLYIFQKIRGGKI